MLHLEDGLYEFIIKKPDGTIAESFRCTEIDEEDFGYSMLLYPSGRLYNIIQPEAFAGYITVREIMDQEELDETPPIDSVIGGVV